MKLTSPVLFGLLALMSGCAKSDNQIEPIDGVLPKDAIGVNVQRSKANNFVSIRFSVVAQKESRSALSSLIEKLKARGYRACAGESSAWESYASSESGVEQRSMRILNFFIDARSRNLLMLVVNEPSEPTDSKQYFAISQSSIPDKVSASIDDTKYMCGVAN